MARSKLYIGASVLFITLLTIRLILYLLNPFEIEEYGQLPGEVAMIVQMVSAFYIVYFYRIQSNELLYGVQSFFVDGYRIMLEKISAMLVTHSMFQLIQLGFVYGLFTVIYYKVGIEPSDFYLSLLRFLIVYMLVPLIFSLLYGLVVAMLFGTKKISFLVILFLWISTGSMSAELFDPFFRNVHADDWQSLLFIGLNSVQYVYQSYFGFDIDSGNELKLLTWFLILTGIILILSLRWTLRVSERNFTKKALLVVFILSFITAKSAVELSTKAFSRADDTTETNYYMNLNKNGIDTDLRYEIKSYVISLTDKQATVQMNFSEMTTLKPTFQLYHAYPVKWIKADDKLVEFKRYGDLIKVSIPANTLTLTFQYEIEDTSFVPYKKDRTTLLANNAWYPKKRATHMYEMNDYIGWIEISESFLPEESYFFTLKANEVLFCNLPQQGEIFRGEAQAVTLIKGQGNQLTYRDYHITYPADWPKMEDRTPMVLSQLERTIHDVQQLAPSTVKSLPKAIVFSNYGLSSFMTQDHLVYNTGYGDAVNSYETMKDFQEKVLNFTIQKKGPDSIFREWVNMASLYIRQKNEWEIDFNGRSPLSDSLSQTEQELIESIYHYFHQLNYEKKQRFLREWYNKMDETWTWQQVLDLVEGWE